MSKAKPKPKRTTRASDARESKRSTRAHGDGAGRASRLIDERIRDLAGWRGETLARMRALILRAEPDMTEEWKWSNPVWSHDGIVCTGEAYAKAVKLTFARGAALPDPAHLFNSSLGGSMRRAIDIREGEELDARAFTALVKAAVARNREPARAGAKARSRAGSARLSKAPGGAKVVLLSGGNPQIARADGDAPVQAYLAALTGWKRDLGERLDALVVRTVPDVRKAVKWNSPMYGIEGRGWFLGFHVFTHHVNVSFFRGTSLRPVPPGGTGKDARYVKLREGEFDEARMTSWVKQAAALPGIWPTT
jgi:hypothetical protein